MLCQPGCQDIRSKGLICTAGDVPSEVGTPPPGASSCSWGVWAGPGRGQEGRRSQLLWGSWLCVRFEPPQWGRSPGMPWQGSDKGGQSLICTLERLMDPGMPGLLGWLSIELLISALVWISGS